MSAHAAATGGLLERDMELQLFSRVIERAERGRGGVVLIEGQAGVGKTELLRVAGSLGEAARLRVLRGRGTELDRPFGFGVVRQLLERCARESPAALVGGAEAAAAVFTPAPAETAARIGASGLADRAHAELVAAGARPRRDRRLLSGRESLTASEDRIAALAADGLTNREIARRQFVTVKAVEWHLRNVYRKLDISSRDELSGALAPDPQAAILG
jgi:DNA-binding CsgD family transcriptional regulator